MRAHQVSGRGGPIQWHVARALERRSVQGNVVFYFAGEPPGVREALDAIDAMEAAAARGARLVLVSSASVYGRRRSGPAAGLACDEEDDLVLRPLPREDRAGAAASAWIEHVALAHADQRGLDVVVARLFDVVVPGAGGAGALEAFEGANDDAAVLEGHGERTGRPDNGPVHLAAQAVSGEPLNVPGDGLDVRAFLHASDAAQMLIELGQAPAARGEIVNVGGSETVTVLGLARRIKQLARTRAPIIRTGAAGGGFDGPRFLVPSLRKLRALVGALPGRPLDRMLVEVVSAARRRLR